MHKVNYLFIFFFNIELIIKRAYELNIVAFNQKFCR